MKFLRKLRSLFRKEELDDEMTAEMRHHVELQTELNVKAGMSEGEARFAALRQFGNVASIQEQAREVRGWVWLEHWMRDFRFSLRSLRRSFGFCAVIIVTLALCSAANTTVLSTLYGLIIKPMPFHDANQLVEIYYSQLKIDRAKNGASVVQYLDFKANANLFERFAMWREWPFTFGEESDPARGMGAQATADIFPLLGVQPLYGRFFTSAECIPGKEHVLVLTQSFWERTYAADPEVVGRVIQFSGSKYTIIGVAPRRLEEFHADVAVLIPYTWNSSQAAPASRPFNMGRLYARIKNSVLHGPALAQLATLEQNYFAQVATPEMRDHITRSGQQVSLGQVRLEQTRSVRTGLIVLQGGALFVLLLGCLNVTGLILARINARQSELAVRQALGASRVALARQTLAEGLLLAGSGALGGLALSWASLKLVNFYAANLVREVEPVVLDGTLLGVTGLLTAVVTLLIVLLPIVKTWRNSLLVSMHGVAPSASASKGTRLAGGMLVSAQVALAVVLLVGGCLLLRSFAKVMAVNPGFDANRIVHGRVGLNSAYANRSNAEALQNRLIAKTKEIPGVDNASGSSALPVAGDFSEFTAPARSSIPGKTETYPSGAYFGITPDFFPTMGITILEGRNFTPADYLPNARRVFIVDRKLAERYFPGRSAVGERFDTGGNPENDMMIIGVVESAKFHGQEERNGRPFVYGTRPVGAGEFSIEVRTTRPLLDVVRDLRSELRSIDPMLPLFQVGTLQMSLEAKVANRRGVMILLGVFSGIALLLAALGIYGMLAYDVAQRTKEIGIRGAIGATRWQVEALILSQGMWKTGVGLVIGLGGAVGLSRYLSSLLFEVQPTDPLSYVGVSVVLLAVAFLACWLPARRAAKVDPVVALRAE